MISVECFKELPLEYESFLIEKYDSFLTTCRYIEVYTPKYKINFMLVREDNKLIDLLIFGNCKDTSRCLNSYVAIDQEIIKACSNKLFEIYPSIKKIIISSSYKNYLINRSFLFDRSTDHIIDLPSSMDEYFSDLGRNTRQHLKNYKARLLRDYPEIKFETIYKADIDEGIIDKIVQMNIDRMIYKGIVPGKNNDDKINFFRYSQHYGCVAYIEIDGVIAAGCIATILNKKIFLQVISHDNNFSKYNVGQLCILYLIETSIEKGMLAFHFLSGDNEYKNRLLGKPHSMFSYFIYRAYSLDYYYSKIKAIVLRILIDFRLSKFSKPIRYAIKYYRRKKWKTQVGDSIISNH
ncbi:MAG: GNAT family N-acetyltransferase [Paludibacter sp.]|nr:GNAT family N-acetyltransferase [Paludibacter sp.]